MDNAITNGKKGGLDTLGKDLEKLREFAVETNKEWSEKLNINRSMQSLVSNHREQFLNWLILHLVFMQDTIHITSEL